MPASIAIIPKEKNTAFQKELEPVISMWVGEDVEEADLVAVLAVAADSPAEADFREVEVHQEAGSLQLFVDFIFLNQ